MTVWLVWVDHRLNSVHSTQELACKHRTRLLGVNGSQLGVTVEPIEVRSDWKPEDGDSRCQDCGAVNMIWFADNEVWNRVMGGPEATEDPGGVVCVPCFGRRAEQAGVRRAWKLVPE